MTSRYDIASGVQTLPQGDPVGEFLDILEFHTSLRWGRHGDQINLYKEVGDARYAICVGIQAIFSIISTNGLIHLARQLEDEVDRGVTDAILKKADDAHRHATGEGIYARGGTSGAGTTIAVQAIGESYASYMRRRDAAVIRSGVFR